MNERNFMKLKTYEFIRRIAQRSGVTQETARKVYDAMGEIVKEEVAKENAVTMVKGLIIYGKRNKARVWENPLIGGVEELPSRVVPRARFSDEFRNYLRDETAD